MKWEWILAGLVFFPFAAGLFSYAVGALCVKKNAGMTEKQETPRDAAVILSVVLEFAVMIWLAVSVCGRIVSGQVPELEIPHVCGMALSFTLDGFRMLYGCVAAFMWMMAAFLSREYLTGHRNNVIPSNLLSVPADDAGSDHGRFPVRRPLHHLYFL